MVPHRPNVRLLAFACIAGAMAAPLQGCIVAAVGAGAGAGYALTQERSVGDTVRDAGLHAAISQSWKEYNVKMADDLDNTVYQGRVLLTGTVPSEDWRAEAVKRTWKVDGVKEVYDEVQIGPEEGFMQDLGDGKITTSLKTSLVADGDVKSINYTITTVHGVVYIIGSARTQAELDRVIDHARNTGDVRRVVSYVRIRPGETPAAQTAGGPPTQPPGPGASAPGAGSPRAGAPPSTASAAPPQPAADEPISTPTPRQQIEVVPLK